jgi:4-hydroxy-tetrahydrodipicolinate reductase
VFSGDDLRAGRPRKKSDLKGADVGIDFSGADVVTEIVRRTMSLGLPLVEGTTGWGNALADVEATVVNAEGTLIHAPNFSYAMNVLFHLVDRAARLFETTPEFEPYIWEHHHSRKTDAPSGTALRLGEILLDRLSRKDLLQIGGNAGPTADNQLGVASVRAGSEPGRHRVGFDGPYETVELSHSARDRAAFASGALFVAAWVEGRRGIFTMKDVMSELMAAAEAETAAAEGERETNYDG